MYAAESLVYEKKEFLARTVGDRTEVNTSNFEIIREINVKIKCTIEFLEHLGKCPP